MTETEFFELVKKRDHSGSPEDTYLQNLATLYFQAAIPDRIPDFLELVQTAINENERIIIDPAFVKEMEGCNWDEIPFERLILK